MAVEYQCYLKNEGGGLIDTTVIFGRDEAHAREKAIAYFLLKSTAACIEVWDGGRRVLSNRRQDFPSSATETVHARTTLP